MDGENETIVSEGSRQLDVQILIITVEILDGPDECGETGNLNFDFQARDFHFFKSFECLRA